MAIEFDPNTLVIKRVPAGRASAQRVLELARGSFELHRTFLSMYGVARPELLADPANEDHVDGTEALLDPNNAVVQRDRVCYLGAYATVESGIKSPDATETMLGVAKTAKWLYADVPGFVDRHAPGKLRAKLAHPKGETGVQLLAVDNDLSSGDRLTVAYRLLKTIIDSSHCRVIHAAVLDSPTAQEEAVWLNKRGIRPKAVSGNVPIREYNLPHRLFTYTPPVD